MNGKIIHAVDHLSDADIEKSCSGDDCTDGAIPLTQKSPLKDSGTRDVFSTGAVRDADDAKGRMDLVPMDVVGRIIVFSREVAEQELTKEHCFCQVMGEIEKVIRGKDVLPAFRAFIVFTRYAYPDMSEAIMDLSVHFRNGASKYAERNWEKFIPLHRFLDSCGRHMLKWYRGDTDENHTAAILWNLICYIWTVEHAPITNQEICDLPWCDEVRKRE